jgi:ribonucleotide reductase alpha subunit
VPWLKTLDASVSACNQGGKRKGAGCVYLEPWHADIESSSSCATTPATRRAAPTT